MFERTWRDTGLLAVAIALGLVLYALARVLSHVLLLVLAAIVLACALAPIASYAERWVPRVVGVLGTYLVVVLVLLGIGWLVGQPLVEQARALALAAPDLSEQAQIWLEERGVPIEGNLEDRVASILSRGAETIVLLAPTIFGAGLEITVVLAMAAYLTVSGPAMRDFTLTLLPPERRDHARETITAVGQTMGGYVRGTVIDGLIVGVITWVVLMILGVRFPLVLALVAFVGELIPVLGPWLAAIPAIGIAATQSIALAVVVGGFYLLLQQFEAYVLLPRIMRSQAKVPPLLTLVALVAGAALAGFVGAILAIPIFGGLYVLFLYVAVPAIRREARAPEPAVPPDGL